MTSNQTYFVAATEIFELVTDPKLWVKVKAITLNGAKRLATKRPRSTTSTVRVAKVNAQGEFETIATLNDSFAITRTRPTWRMHKPTTGQASA